MKLGLKIARAMRNAWLHTKWILINCSLGAERVFMFALIPAAAQLPRSKTKQRILFLVGLLLVSVKAFRRTRRFYTFNNWFFNQLISLICFPEQIKSIATIIVWLEWTIKEINIQIVIFSNPSGPLCIILILKCLARVQIWLI